MSFINVKNITLDFFVPGKNCSASTFMSNIHSEVGGQTRFGPSSMTIRALDNISFSLEDGDRVALLGHNGAGKTTLLRVLAGIYVPNKGVVQRDGLLSAVFDLKFGMDPDLSGYDNILIRAMYLGVKKDKVNEMISEVADFSELGGYLHAPLRIYSAGMKARLAFAIATTLINPEILLLDESVGTGDAAFVDKAKKKLVDKVSDAKILVLASHSDKILRELCNKAILLNRGKLVDFGEINVVLECYRRYLVAAGDPNAIAAAKKRANVRLSARNNSCIVWANNTGKTSNPGCIAVERGLNYIFNRYFKNQESFELNYWADNFSRLSPRSSLCINRVDSMLPRWALSAPSVNFREWECIRRELSSLDSGFHERMQKSNLFVINGEGSIHHNFSRALALLAMAKTAILNDKKVVLLNSTVQAIDVDILRDALCGIHFIHSRERFTYEYLHNIGFKSFLAPDVALLGLNSVDDGVPLVGSSGKCLVTLGVTALRNTLRSVFDIILKDGIEPVYFCVGDANEEVVAREVCDDLGIPLIFSRNVPFSNLIPFLRQFSCAVSGRHHINIFLLKARVPFVALPSNTWKIEGTLELFGIKDNFATSIDSISTILNDIKLSASKFLIDSNEFDQMTSGLEKIMDKCFSTMVKEFESLTE